MWRMTTTQSKYVGPNQNSICSIEKLLTTVPQEFSQEDKKVVTAHGKKSSQAKDVKRGVLKRGKYTSI